MELYTIVKFVKFVQGSYHQGHTKFGETAGRQSHPVWVQKLDLYENEATYQARFSTTIV